MIEFIIGNIKCWQRYRPGATLECPNFFAEGKESPTQASLYLRCHYIHQAATLLVLCSVPSKFSGIGGWPTGPLATPLLSTDSYCYRLSVRRIDRVTFLIALSFSHN